MRLIVPPTRENEAKGVKDAEPSSPQCNLNGKHFFLKEILVVFVVLTRLDNVFERFSTEDHAHSPACSICRLNDKWPSEQSQFRKRQLYFLSVVIGRYDDRKGNMDSV